MRVFVRAVITGIGLSVGKAIYDRISARLFDEPHGERDDPSTATDVPDDPSLVREPQ